MKHLWEIEHPYYCSESNYFTYDKNCSMHYNSWDEYLRYNEDEDPEYNLIFRFDWEDDILKLFYIGQRKGIYRWVTIDVRHRDESSIKEFLKIRYEHLKKLWEPFNE